jgi:site-specific DNA-methyltransferase (adenine-specific)
LAVAVEDAGFEIRDNIAWIYGSGFPKSLDVSKAIDKRAGAEREKWPTLAMQKKGEVGEISKNRRCAVCHKALASGNPCQCDRKETAITSEAKSWEGWGTALKPAHEPVVVGRKPLTGTVAENVLEWGVGGLNIDGSRIGFRNEADKNTVQGAQWHAVPNDTYGKFQRQHDREVMNGADSTPDKGRWPANVIFDEVTAGLLDEQSGNRPGATSNSSGGKEVGIFGAYGSLDKAPGYADSGGASRFFYVAKASKRDRNEGLEELEARQVFGDEGNTYQGLSNSKNPSNNFHPTVKPTALMRYLIKLVTPPGGTVLDPFTGSGSTGKAALLDGFGFVGVELTEEYLPIIEGRLQWAIEQEGDDDVTLF